MIRKLILGLSLATAATLVACNTVDGAGQDLQSASSTVENAID